MNPYHYDALEHEERLRREQIHPLSGIDPSMNHYVHPTPASHGANGYMHGYHQHPSYSTSIVHNNSHMNFSMDHEPYHSTNYGYSFHNPPRTNYMAQWPQQENHSMPLVAPPVANMHPNEPLIQAPVHTMHHTYPIPAMQSSSSSPQSYTSGPQGHSMALESLHDSTTSREEAQNLSKKEKRKSQVRDASRRRRAKRKDEESRLRERIQELTHQIQIMGSHGSDAVSNEALEEAYMQQVKVVEHLQEKNRQYKEKLSQHEQFTRMVHDGIQQITDTQQLSLPTPTSDSMVPIALSTDSEWLNQWSQQIVRDSYQELINLHLPTNLKIITTVAMGWKTQVWQNEHQMELISTKKVSKTTETKNKTWKILTTFEKRRRVFPDIKALEIAKTVSDNISIVISRSGHPNGPDRHFISVIYCIEELDGSIFVGIKSYDKESTWNHTNAISIENYGWKISNDYIFFYGQYNTIEKKKKEINLILEQQNSEIMFSLVRWESEAISPLFSIEL